MKVDGGSGVNSIQGAVVTTAIGTGTEGADVIEVSETSTGAIMVTVNGTMSTFAAGTRVRVDALGGDDRVTLRNLNVDAVVDAGAGNDVVDGSGVVAGKLTLGARRHRTVQRRRPVERAVVDHDYAAIAPAPDRADGRFAVAPFTVEGRWGVIAAAIPAGSLTTLSMKCAP